jgi:hypothetical protein
VPNVDLDTTRDRFERSEKEETSMFGKHRTLEHLSGAVTIAAALAIVAALSAGAAQAREITCTASDAVTSSAYPGWVSLDDDLGVAWLYPKEQSPYPSRQTCANTQSANAATPAPTGTQASVPDVPTFRSPYPGWSIVFDDLRLPWLYPTGSVAG